MLFRKRENPDSRGSSAAAMLHTDLHSHILPGIDDGARTLDDSLDMLNLLSAMGYHGVVTTPHVMAVHYPNTREIIGEAEHNLRLAMDDAGLNMGLKVAAEYMLDDDFGRLLSQGDLLTFGESNILVECPFLQPYPGTKEYIFELQLAGYQPVLAHPERYAYWQADPNGLDELHSAGILFQVNLMSLAGRYGPGVRKHAEGLLRKGMVHFLGSDLHTINSADEIQKGLANPLVAQYVPSLRNASL